MIFQWPGILKFSPFFKEFDPGCHLRFYRKLHYRYTLNCVSLHFSNTGLQYS